MALLRYAALVTVTAVILAAAAPTVAAAPEPEVTGYLLGGAPNRLIDRNAAGLDEVGIDGVLLRAGGRQVDLPSADAVRLLRHAHRQGLRAELLLSNYSDLLGDFDPVAAARLLRHPANVDRVAGRLARVARVQGWDGITVDLESLARKDGRGLVRLVRQLQTRMPADRTVSIDLMASTTSAGFRDRGYLLAALGRSADVVAVMTYDNHGPTWSGPGPIGGLRWQRRVLVPLLAAVPRTKLDLGIAGYAYTWPRHGTGRVLSVAGARRVVAADGAVAHWRPGPAEWTATLSNGTVLWWSDRRSFAARLDLATKRHLHGVALWRLGSTDTLG
ncbi:glycosyl hydrolase family 18 protein [Nocardioides sp.]|uniref:glycosyl hydrolase family 18 protein n=1 Tax=Nocardioides sp. TaxID=35761 RepID=UPI003D13CF6B